MTLKVNIEVCMDCSSCKSQITGDSYCLECYYRQCETTASLRMAVSRLQAMPRDKTEERLEKLELAINDLIAYITRKKQVESLKTSKGLAKKQREYVFQRDGDVCANCKKSYPRAFLHIDHIIPRAKGGSNDPTNLQVLCKDCNLIKSSHIYAAQGKEEFQLQDR